MFVIVLLILSLMLHLITFYWLIIFMQRINQLKSSHPETVKKEIEESLSTYLLDMKEDNQRLLANLRPLIDNYNRQHEVNEERVVGDHALADVDTESAEPQKDTDRHTIPSAEVQQPKSMTNPLTDEGDYQPPILKETESFEPSLQVQVAELHEKGYNETDIAKKLNRGKGEIQLILKFNQKR